MQRAALFDLYTVPVPRVETRPMASMDEVRQNSPRPRPGAACHGLIAIAHHLCIFVNCSTWELCPGLLPRYWLASLESQLVPSSYFRVACVQLSGLTICSCIHFHTNLFKLSGGDSFPRQLEVHLACMAGCSNLTVDIRLVHVRDSTTQWRTSRDQYKAMTTKHANDNPESHSLNDT